MATTILPGRSRVFQSAEKGKGPMLGFEWSYDKGKYSCDVIFFDAMTGVLKRENRDVDSKKTTLFEHGDISTHDFNLCINFCSNFINQIPVNNTVPWVDLVVAQLQSETAHPNFDFTKYYELN
jgi:hypothetical protein